MSIEVYSPPATTMSRPQIGIDRLPVHRLSRTAEVREAMNCKSCRKRKIKCNRTRPTCESCQVFNCPCIYDAIPKKRGPKTDVLENLLKRVDGLEKRLVSEGKSDAPQEADSSSSTTGDANSDNTAVPASQSRQGRPLLEIAPNPGPSGNQLMSPVEPSIQTPNLVPGLLLDTYFARIHGKPYHILDEAITRQRVHANQLPPHLAYAIYAVSARYAPDIGGYNAAVRAGQEYARRSRLELDIDEPSIETLQTLMLLAQANFQIGKGKTTFMLLTSAISMAFALDLHRELPLALNVAPLEREGRRRLFWSIYLMDRFAATGSKRPSLIADESIVLRLPCWQLHPGAMLLEGDFFQNGANLQYMAGSGKGGQGSMGMLIGIAKILGITNRYLASGGVKGDSHFPWHSLSNLSKIRHELDIWASETQDRFTAIDTLFGQSDSTILVLSKLIYHLIHCLIYRPFLPVDLAELSGPSQHQSWQIEATNLCFLHANAIAELVEIGRASSMIDWPEFVGYCVCTAGTIHIHGAHYPGREGEVFSVSSEFLSREMHQLSDLRFMWAGVQHQRDTLQMIYACHMELVKSLASNPIRFSPVFQLEDFFNRYPGQVFDGAHVSFSTIQVDTLHESNLSTYNIEPYRNSGMANIDYQPTIPSSSYTNNGAPSKKRRLTTSGAPKPRTQSVPQPTEAPLPHSGNPIVNTPIPPDPQASAPIATSTRPLTPPATSSNLNIPNLGAFDNLGFSPNFSFSPLPQFASLAPSPGPANNDDAAPHFDPMLSMPTPYEQQPTPGAASASGSAHTDPENRDPFLSFLERLAENEMDRVDGPSALDFFLQSNV